MKKLTIVVFMGVLALMMAGPASAYVYQDNFETAWTGNYAPGWQNEGYRWGETPVAIMTQTTTAKSGSYGVKITADSVVRSSDYWSIVYNENVNAYAMQKQFDPYIKVWYYDNVVTTPLARTGQLYAIPLAVTTPDWTDIQFGGRIRTDIPINYYYVSSQWVGTAWSDTGVARTEGWHELMFQLSSTDGKVHFYLDGNAVGTSPRSDLTNLDTGMLAVMFQAPLGDWGVNKPYAIFDNFEAGSTSTIPLPGAVWLLGSGLAGLGLIRRVQFFKR